MKRIIAILLCVMLIGALAMPIAAAGAHMSISSSNSTVHRGEAFELTVSLSNNEPVSNGAIILSYDTSVFELTGGNCTVSDATLAEVSAANGGGVFMLQNDAVVSGTIFTINMKVKSDAAFGTFSISGTPSLSIDCGISGTSVTVACQHSFGNSSKVDDSKHESKCTICGEKKQDAHTWNDGTVTKAPTCKDAGSKTVKCTACGAEKTETVPVTDKHTYGGWSNQGGSGHSHVCSVCGKEESSSHSWYTAQVLEEATCQTTGRKTIICDDCGASAEEEIPVADHTYGAPTEATAAGHTLKCTVCGTTTTAEHTFGETLEHDQQAHYYACQLCGYKKDQEEHNPGPKATEETDQICTDCNRVLKPKGKHQHEFVKEWSSDDKNHWHICVDCPVRDSELPHVFDNDCDADCNTCGLTRQVAHIVSPLVEFDETGHWYSCLICGEKQEFAAHVPGPEATISTNQTCTVCGFELAPAVPHDHVFDGNGTVHFHKCACGLECETDAQTCSICAEAHKTFPWWIVCIAEAVIFIVVILVLLLRKKKTVKKEQIFWDEETETLTKEETKFVEDTEQETAEEPKNIDFSVTEPAEQTEPESDGEIDSFEDLKARIDRILGEDNSNDSENIEN